MPPKPPVTPEAEQRQRRLAEALRANLRKRKAQARDRTDQAARLPATPPKPSTDAKR